MIAGPNGWGEHAPPRVAVGALANRSWVKIREADVNEFFAAKNSSSFQFGQPVVPGCGISDIRDVLVNLLVIND